METIIGIEVEMYIEGVEQLIDLEDGNQQHQSEELILQLEPEQTWHLEQLQLEPGLTQHLWKLDQLELIYQLEQTLDQQGLNQQGLNQQEQTLDQQGLLQGQFELNQLEQTPEDNDK